MIAMTLLAIFVALFGCGMGALMLRGQRDAKAWVAASLFAGGGILAGWWVYSTDQQQRRETLYEVMTEGSEGLTIGQKAPVLNLEFEVEHPGVGHTLMVSPSAHNAPAPTGNAELSFELKDPEGRVLVKDQRVYGVRGATKGSRADWGAAYFDFLPTRPGKHTLVLTILTVGVPHVHVRVVDPENTDGVRIPGF